MKRLLLIYFLFLRLSGSGFKGFSTFEMKEGHAFVGLFIRRRMLYKEPFLWPSIRKVAIDFLSVVIDAGICMAMEGSNTRVSR